MSNHRLWTPNGYAPYWEEGLETMPRGSSGRCSSDS